MFFTGKTILVTSCLLWSGVFIVRIGCPAYGSDFTAFAEAEEICRKVGTQSIDGASGPSAARHYDFAYRQCMVAQSRIRQSGATPPGIPPAGSGTIGNSGNFEYPNAFYAIPYATPGYGYDGFGY